jgi:hypothetical protein
MFKQNNCIGLKLYTIQTPHPPWLSYNDIVLGINVKQKISKKMHSGHESKQAANYIGKFFCTFRRLYTVFARVRMDGKWVYVRMGEVGRG